MTHVCQDCGLISVANLDTNHYYCPNGATCKGSKVLVYEAFSY
jgi:hypothetical protein